jgi:hypothetical protein
MTTTPPQYDFICSIGELIDKLSIQNIICYDANNKIIAERKKENSDHIYISSLEFKARTSGEQRVRLKDEINRRIAEAINRGTIGCSKDMRTYDL